MKDQILTEIIRVVNKYGDCVVPLELLRPAFGCEGRQTLCIKESLLIWAVENRIIYEYKEINQATEVRFFSSKE